MLVLHGWQDNCGSFDRLIPMLPPHLGYLAIDFPGHGYSSQIPPGMFYYNSNGILLIRQIMLYLEWDKISLMGHSLGSITSYIFGSTMPELVDFAVCIDGLHPLINPQGTNRIVRTVNEFIKYDKLNSANLASSEEPPSYTMAEMEQKLHLGTRKSIDLETCKYILERNIAPSKKNPGKFYFNRDPRLKCGPLTNISMEELIEQAKRVTFPLFISKFDKSPFFGNKDHFYEIFVHIQKSSKDCEFHDGIPGQHHGHLNNPVVLKDVVTKFILKHDQSDRSKGGIKKEIIYNGDK